MNLAQALARCMDLMNCIFQQHEFHVMRGIEIDVMPTGKCEVKIEVGYCSPGSDA
jgi:hypothetical protein